MDLKTKVLTKTTTTTKVLTLVACVFAVAVGVTIAAVNNDYSKQTGYKSEEILFCIATKTGIITRESKSVDGKVNYVIKRLANGCQDIGYENKNYTFGCIHNKNTKKYYKFTKWTPCAQQVQVAPSSQERQYDAQTKELLNNITRYSKVASKYKTYKKAFLLQIKKQALERRMLLLSVIENDPISAKDLIIEDATLKKIPKELSPFFEKPYTIQGEIERFEIDEVDYETGEFINSRTKYYFKSTSKQRYPLNFTHKPDDIISGTVAKMKVYKLGTNLLVDNSVESNFQVQKTPDSKISTKSTKAEVTKDLSVVDSKVAVILFNFQNNSDSEPYSVEDARMGMFTAEDSVKAYYEEISFGQQTFSGFNDPENGDVYGWYTVPMNNTSCDDSLNAMADMANELAAQDGFDESNYDFVVYGVSQNALCSASGASGGPGSKILFNLTYYFNIGTVAHEFGHNFGLGHASTYSCVDEQGARVVYSNACTLGEYGDIFSSMGNSQLRRHFNASQKKSVGWLTNENVIDVSQSGDYLITPIEELSDGYQLIRVPKEYNDEGIAVSYYTIDYRQPYGFDDFSSSDPVVNGVLIRIEDNVGDHLQTYLLDSTAQASYTFEDSAFLVGDKFIEPNGHFEVEVIDANSDYAEVRIELFDIEPTLSIKKNITSPGDDKGDVLVVSDPAGINCGRICTSSFPKGTEVTLTATPNEYTRFGGFTSLSGWTDSPEYSFIMNSDKIVTASYIRQTRYGKDVRFGIKGVIEGEAPVLLYYNFFGGSVNIDPPDIEKNISIDGYGVISGTYEQGAKVNLEFLRNNYGYMFTHWSEEDCGSNQTCEIVLPNTNKTVTAYFDRKVKMCATVWGDGKYGGRVVSDPQGIDCSDTSTTTNGCCGLFDANTDVILQAVDGEHSFFDYWDLIYWEGQGCDDSRECTMNTGDSAKSVKAYFTIENRKTGLSISKQGDGNGYISLVSGEIDCDKDCDGKYIVQDGIWLSLLASPDNNSVFSHWDGQGVSSCGSSDQCQIRAGNTSFINAYFEPRYICTDGDYGDDLTVQSTVTIEDKGTGEVTEYTDECHENYIWEYQCGEDNQIYVDASQMCPNSFMCSEGICVASNTSVEVKVSSDSPSVFVREGSNVPMFAFDVVNNSPDELLINKMVFKNTGDSATSSLLNRLSLNFENTSMPGSVLENGEDVRFTFGIPAHIASGETKQIIIYANSIEGYVGDEIELQLYSIDSSANKVSGMPLTSHRVDVVDSQTIGFPDAQLLTYFGNGMINNGVEVSANGYLSIIVKNYGDQQFKGRLYYKTEWLDADYNVIETEEKRGERVASPGQLDYMSFVIPNNDQIKIARISVDSREQMDEGLFGETNNVTIYHLP
ncbi:MAG: hypothetical protein ABIH21_02050 [Patescibacteria group bacterium]